MWKDSRGACMRGAVVAEHQSVLQANRSRLYRNRWFFQCQFNQNNSDHI